MSLGIRLGQNLRQNVTPRARAREARQKSGTQAVFGKMGVAESDDGGSGAEPCRHPSRSAADSDRVSVTLPVGGLLLALGLFTRPVAFVLAGNMAVAYFIAHAPRGFFPLLNGGELAIVYCFVFLYLWVSGGGERSLDRLRAPASEPVLSPRRA